MVRSLPKSGPSSQAFRDHAHAILRLSRSRGRAECEALGLAFEDEALTDERRVLILDLLATAGTPEAQIVMRRILALAIARRSAQTFATFVQRLGFLERPDGATLRFLMSVYAESRNQSHDIRSSHAYALAAAAGRAHVWGLVDPALHTSELLRRDLYAATNVTEKCSLLTALGNAGLENDVVLILRFTTDSDESVRVAATLALRKMHTREARGHLLSMIAGGERVVAEAALSALFGQTFAGEDIARLTELVLAGRTALALDTRILRLIVTQKRSMPSNQVPAEEVDQAIHLLLARIEGSLAAAPSLLSQPPPALPTMKSLAIPALAPPPNVEQDDAANELEPEQEQEQEQEHENVRESSVRFVTHKQAERDQEEERERGSEVRTKSAFAVAMPIRPLAVIR